MCGHKEDKYLEISDFDNMNVLSAVESERHALHFYVENTPTLGNFKLKYVCDPKPMYIARSATTYLQVGGGRAARFSVHSSWGANEAPLTVDDWVREARYVRIAPSKGQGVGYFGFNEDEEMVEFVPDGRNNPEEEGAMWLQCKLKRPKTERNADGTYKAPREPIIRKGIQIYPNDSESDDEIEFGDDKKESDKNKESGVGTNDKKESGVVHR